MLLKQGNEIMIGYEMAQGPDLKYVEFTHTLESDWEFPAGDSFINNLVIPLIEEHLGGDIYNDDGDYRAWHWRADFQTVTGAWIDLINFEEETA